MWRERWRGRCESSVNGIVLVWVNETVHQSVGPCFNNASSVGLILQWHGRARRLKFSRAHGVELVLVRSRLFMSSTSRGLGREFLAIAADVAEEHFAIDRVPDLEKVQSDNCRGQRTVTRLTVWVNSGLRGRVHDVNRSKKFSAWDGSQMVVLGEGLR